MSDATKSISELITVEGDINLDFRDVETTLRGGGGAIMAMGRGQGEHRVERAVIDALDSPLLYGNEIDKAKRILLNIYTSEAHPLFVSEMNEIDQFMDALDPNIDVIWGVSKDNTLGEDAKVTILATGFEDATAATSVDLSNTNYFESLITKLYKPYKRQLFGFTQQPVAQLETPTDEAETTEDDVSVTFNMPINLEEPNSILPETTEKNVPDEPIENNSMTFRMDTNPQPSHEQKSSLLSKAKALMDRITDLTQED